MEPQDLKSMSRSQLEERIEMFETESAQWFVERIIGILEIEKRIHEIKFHGREEENGEDAIPELSEALNVSFRHLAQWIKEKVFELNRVRTNENIWHTRR